MSHAGAAKAPRGPVGRGSRRAVGAPRAEVVERIARWRGSSLARGGGLSSLPAKRPTRQNPAIPVRGFASFRIPRVSRFQIGKPWAELWQAFQAFGRWD